MDGPVKLAVVAGLFMGEGWVGIRKLRDKERWKARLTIANTDSEIVEFCQTVLAGSVTIQKRTPPEKPVYYLTINNYGNVLVALERMRPFLVGRKALVADSMVSLCRSRAQNGVPLSLLQRRFIGGRGGYSDSDLALIERIRILNSRGIHPEKGLRKEEIA